MTGTVNFLMDMRSLCWVRGSEDWDYDEDIRAMATSFPRFVVSLARNLLYLPPG